MSEIITYPPAATGTEREQLVALRAYLIRLADLLNRAEDVTGEQVQLVEKTATEAAKKAGQAGIENASARLKALILQNATEVRSEIESIERTLVSDYLAKSDFGTYQEIIEARFTATPDAVRQAIDYDATISGIDEALGVLQNYRIETQGYIKSGIVDWDEDGVTPIIGIAIGQDLHTVGDPVEYQGRTYYEIDKTQKFLSIITSMGLNFYEGESRVAYFTNERMYITEATITGKLRLSGDWVFDHTDGLAIKWVGA